MTKASRQGTKPADPELAAGRPERKLQPFAIRRWVGAGLYVLFSFILILPLVRRWRRKSWWTFARAVLALTGVALAGAWAVGWPGALPGGAGAALLVCALWLGPLTDPDFERKLQRRHRAEYLLNGGVLVEGTFPGAAPLGADEALYLLIRSPHVMVVAKKGDGEVHAAIDIRRIERIEVGGEVYVPTYVSEAKDPPVRATSVDRNAMVDMQLTMDDGSRLGFRYRGAFPKHLAETAAHGIYSMRADLKSSNSADALPVLR